MCKLGYTKPQRCYEGIEFIHVSRKDTFLTPAVSTQSIELGRGAWWSHFPASLLCKRNTWETAVKFLEPQRHRLGSVAQCCNFRRETVEFSHSLGGAAEDPLLLIWRWGESRNENPLWVKEGILFWVSDKPRGIVFLAARELLALWWDPNSNRGNTFWLLSNRRCN